ncbi:MAG: outer membrane protein assembly factor BamA [Verrucomicrobia bacterium]|nr:outer membrane protein assembly factor BamA [Verrucomicrobiota bacterium]MCH8525702.1 outer membrane protein assembly factor BamA [Kiritimatiellia bacterium]
MRCNPLLLTVFFLLAPLIHAQQATVRSVEVRSRVPGRSVDASTVLSFVSKAPGQPFEPQQVNNDIRRLQETGRYSFVAAELRENSDQSLTLIYVIEERPRLRRILIEGGDHFSNARIRNLLELNLGDRVDEPLVRQRIEPIRERYQKAFFPDVSFEISLTPPDENKFTDLRIIVDEGERQSVGRIRFEGNTEYSSTQLRRVMMQKTTSLFSFITKRGVFNETFLNQDMGTLAEMYRRRGYLDARAGPPEIDQGWGRRLNVTIPIDRAERFVINSIQIEGNTLFPSSLLGAQIPLQVGQPAFTDRIEAGRQAIRDFYNNRGYSQTVVREQIQLDGENRVNIIYSVQEGRVATVRNVNVRGNTRTKDHVLRRELLVAPGDTLNEVRVRNSAARLRNLGFFDGVNQAILPTSDPLLYDVEFEVSEGRSGQFLAGAGFSSIDNLVGFVELSQGNFDLTDPPRFTGGGEKLQLRLQLGTSRRDAELNYTKPWVFDRRMSFTTSLFQNDRRFLSDDYNQRNTGASFGLRKGLTANWRGGVTYTIENIDVYDVDEDAAEIIRIEEGDSLRSGLDFSLTRDTRNHVWNPTRGGRVVLNTGFTGGPLGADEDIYEAGVRASHFYPVIWDHVLNIQGWVRSVEYYGRSERVPIFDRLFLGGARTIRGFKFREVSPVDEEQREVGGQTMMFASAEYSIPLSEMFRYAMFYDWGVVNPDSFDLAADEPNSSYGIGLRIDLPGFPLRLDYSWQHLNSEHNERERPRFSFLIGYSF